MGKNENDCYLVVFAHKNSQSNGIILGNIVLQKYLTVFDVTPYDERNQNYVQIGIANSAPKDKLKTQLMIDNEAKKEAWEKMKQEEKNKKEEETRKEQEEEKSEEDKEEFQREAEEDREKSEDQKGIVLIAIVAALGVLILVAIGCLIKCICARKHEDKTFAKAATMKSIYVNDTDDSEMDGKKIRLVSGGKNKIGEIVDQSVVTTDADDIHRGATNVALKHNETIK